MIIKTINYAMRFFLLKEDENRRDEKKAIEIFDTQLLLLLKTL